MFAAVIPHFAAISRIPISEGSFSLKSSIAAAFICSRSAVLGFRKMNLLVFFLFTFVIYNLTLFTFEVNTNCEK